MVILTIETSPTVLLTIEQPEDIVLEIGETTIIHGGDIYTGEYEFTPTEETQTVPINGLVATRNITIDPIPTNYGLITWNGTTIMVS